VAPAARHTRAVPAARRIGRAVDFQARRRAAAVALARLGRRRITALSLALLLAFSVIAVRLVQLQALSGSHYQQLALAQRLDKVVLPAERGSIFDREGRDLALSVEQPTIWANPRVVTDPAYEAAKLAPLVGVREATLQARLSQHNLQFVYIARRVDDNVAARVKALQLPGVAFYDEPRREYPAGSVAAPLLGLVGTDDTGLAGLEAEYNSILQGKPGEIVSERDVDGREIPRTVRREVPAQRGTDLMLTIDEALQYQAEHSLVDQVAATSAQGGMAVIIDTQTGNILAMATAVGPSPGQPAHAASALYRNRPLTDVFEPGSTNKVITISTAIQDGVVKPTQTFAVPDHITIGGQTYWDDERHPTQLWTTTDILRESSNVGTIMIAEQLGKARLNTALRAFGLGRPTSAQFPGQASGLLLDPSHYYSTGLSSGAIGYGVAVSAQQMLDVYATVANDGVTRPPRLVGATIGADGRQHAMPVPPGTRVLEPWTAGAMTSMLTQVVANGTGACAAIPGYTVAGKTGTSRKPLATGGYTAGRTMASFIGFAPAEAPRIAAIVVLDQPATVYGAVAAAPVFSEIAGSALRLLRVPPPTANDPQFMQAQATANASHSNCSVPHGGALMNLLAAKAHEAQLLKAHQLQATAATTATRTGANASRGTGTAGGTGVTTATSATGAKQEQQHAPGTIPAATSANP
jgi:cell division protein FtsI (penicillin-binding protein 3)